MRSQRNQPTRRLKRPPPTVQVAVSEATTEVTVAGNAVLDASAAPMRALPPRHRKKPVKPWRRMKCMPSRPTRLRVTATSARQQPLLHRPQKWWHLRPHQSMPHNKMRPLNQQQRQVVMQRTQNSRCVHHVRSVHVTVMVVIAASAMVRANAVMKQKSQPMRLRTLFQRQTQMPALIWLHLLCNQLCRQKALPKPRLRRPCQRFNRIHCPCKTCRQLRKAQAWNGLHPTQRKLHKSRRPLQPRRLLPTYRVSARHLSPWTKVLWS